MDIIWPICAIFACIIIICAIISCWLGIPSIPGLPICWLNLPGCICCRGLNPGWVCCGGCWWMKFPLIGEWFTTVPRPPLAVPRIPMPLPRKEIAGVLGLLGIAAPKRGPTGTSDAGRLFWPSCVESDSFRFSGWEVSGARAELRRREFPCGVAAEAAVPAVSGGVVAGWVADPADVIDSDLTKSQSRNAGSKSEPTKSSISDWTRSVCQCISFKSTHPQEPFATDL